LRDLDVQQAINGGRASAGGRARRHDAWRALCGELEGQRARAFFRALDDVSRPKKTKASRRLSRLVERTLAREQALRGDWHDAARLHALRQAVRRVRYGLECAGHPIAEIAALQGALGDAQDLAIAVRRESTPRLERQLNQAQRQAHRRWDKAERALKRSL
jgi:CHAD domain-containing protein